MKLTAVLTLTALTAAGCSATTPHPSPRAAAGEVEQQRNTQALLDGVFPEPVVAGTMPPGWSNLRTGFKWLGENDLAYTGPVPLPGALSQPALDAQIEPAPRPPAGGADTPEDAH